MRMGRRWYRPEVLYGGSGRVQRAIRVLRNAPLVSQMTEILNRSRQ